MKVAVLGHRGMLGRVVSRYFEERGAKVWTTKLRYQAIDEDPYLAAVESSRADVIINCAGILVEEDPMLWPVNAVLPRELCRLSWARIIHASTDAVREPTCYGMSKATGELGDIIIRGAIVDPLGGILRWLHHQEAVIGFTDQLWNGITTLYWAKLAWASAEGIIDRHLIIPTSPGVTGAELLRATAEVYGWPVRITDGESGSPRDRRQVGNHQAPHIREQLEELRAWRS